MTFSTGLLRGFGNNSYADLLFVETLPLLASVRCF